MKFYLSYWSYADLGCNKNDLSQTIDFTKKCVDLINQHYGEAYFITDEIGKQLFKEVKWAKVDTYLDIVPKIYSATWSLGKLFALNKITYYNEPFVHLDYDFLIFNKVNEEFFNKNIFVQSREIDLVNLGYEIDYFENTCPNKYLGNNIKTKYAYNCGIMGGKDVDFFRKYTKSSIDMVLDEDNKKFWLEKHYTKTNNFKTWTKAILAEQYHLGLVAKNLNKKINLFFEDLAPSASVNHNGEYVPSNLNFYKESGCIHLYGDFKRKLYPFRRKSDILTQQEDEGEDILSQN